MPNQNERTALEMAKPMWPNRLRSKSRSPAAWSGSCAAFISFITHGWHRIAPWPKISRLRVMMLAPSTVIAIGEACQARPPRLRGPRMMPLPPTISMKSLADWRPISVQWYLAMADGTDGTSPRSTAAAVACDSALAA